jgi:hypothetical protein
MLYWPADAVSSIHGGGTTVRSARFADAGKAVSKSIFPRCHSALRAKQSSPWEAARDRQEHNEIALTASR